MREVFAVAVFCLLGLEGCSTSCTQAGCVDNVRTTFELDRPAAELTGGTLRICRDGACSSDPIELVGDAGTPGSFFRCGLHRCVEGASPKALRLTVTLFPQPRPNELVEITLSIRNGEVIASRKGNVTFEPIYPNGKECGADCVGGELN